MTKITYPIEVRR